MSKGFGMLTNLKNLNLTNCEKLESLPESESQMTSHFLISNFGNLIPEGFGLLVNLTDLNMYRCESICSLPESETRCCIFYFLDF